MQMWSLNDNNTPYIGRAYFKTGTASIFILKIARFAIEDTQFHGESVSEAYQRFLYTLLYAEVHERLHLFFKQELGKMAYSEKVIHSLEKPLMQALMIEQRLYDYVNLFWEVFEWMKEQIE